MRPTRYLVVPALFAIFPHHAFAQNNDGLTAGANAEAAANGYSSYVSEMEKQQSINDMKETATYSWAKVSYKAAAAASQTASVEATEQQAVSTSTMMVPATTDQYTQAEAAATTSSDAVPAPSPSQQAIAGGSDSIAQQTESDDDGPDMMPIGIGIAFGVLAVLVGLITSMIIYNRRKARRDFALRTQGLQNMAQASV